MARFRWYCLCDYQHRDGRRIQHLLSRGTWWGRIFRISALTLAQIAATTLCHWPFLSFHYSWKESYSPDLNLSLYESGSEELIVLTIPITLYCQLFVSKRATNHYTRVNSELHTPVIGSLSLSTTLVKDIMYHSSRLICNQTNMALQIRVLKRLNQHNSLWFPCPFHLRKVSEFSTSYLFTATKPIVLCPKQKTILREQYRPCAATLDNGLLFICRKIHNEAASIFYGHQTFHYSMRCKDMWHLQLQSTQIFHSSDTLVLNTQYSIDTDTRQIMPMRGLRVISFKSKKILCLFGLSASIFVPLMPSTRLIRTFWATHGAQGVYRCWNSVSTA